MDFTPYERKKQTSTFFIIAGLLARHKSTHGYKDKFFYYIIESPVKKNQHCE